MNTYSQLHGGIEELENYDTNSFDITLCHNVLEYIESKDPIIAELFRVLKPQGLLSIVKHNRAGRIFHRAVYSNDPVKALALLDKANDMSNYLGIQYIYSNDDIIEWAKGYSGVIEKIMGMRTFWSLGQDNTIKYNDDWYNNTFELENRVTEIDEFKNVAFYNHLLFRKRD